MKTQQEVDMCIPALSPALLFAMLENDVLYWTLANEGDPDLQPEIVACDLYEHAGYLNRFGCTIPDAVDALLRDEHVFEKALLCLEQSVGDFDSRVLTFMTSERGEREDAETLILDRDRWEVMMHSMATTQDASSHRLRDAWSTYGRIDERMHGRLAEFLPAVPWLLSFRELFGDDHLDRVRYWWFYEIPGLMASDDDFVILPYNCIDAVQFPPFVLSDYVCDQLTAEERVAFEDHMRICDGCRKHVEEIREMENDPDCSKPDEPEE